MALRIEALIALHVDGDASKEMAIAFVEMQLIDSQGIHLELMMGFCRR